MKDIKPLKLEQFIDSFLEKMQKYAPMYGSPEALEGECIILLHLIDEFCVEEEFSSSSFYHALRKELYPKCPSPMSFHQYFTDEKYGLGLDWTEASHKVVDFFILLRKRMKLGNS